MWTDPERLVYTESMSDEHGNVMARHLDRQPANSGAPPRSAHIRQARRPPPMTARRLGQQDAVLGGHAQSVADVLDELRPGVLDLCPGSVPRRADPCGSAPGGQPCSRRPAGRRCRPDRDGSGTPWRPAATGRPMLERRRWSTPRRVPRDVLHRAQLDPSLLADELSHDGWQLLEPLCHLDLQGRKSTTASHQRPALRLGVSATPVSSNRRRPTTMVDASSPRSREGCVRQRGRELRAHERLILRPRRLAAHLPGSAVPRRQSEEGRGPGGERCRTFASRRPDTPCLRRRGTWAFRLALFVVGSTDTSSRRRTGKCRPSVSRSSTALLRSGTRRDWPLPASSKALSSMR